MKSEEEILNRIENLETQLKNRNFKYASDMGMEIRLELDTLKWVIRK